MTYYKPDEVPTPAQVRNRIWPADPDHVFYIGDDIFQLEWQAGSSPVISAHHLHGMKNVEIVLPLQNANFSDGPAFMRVRLYGNSE